MKITQERVEDILARYIDNDLNLSDSAYVREVLVNVCDVTPEEAKALGIDYLFDSED